MEYTQSCAGRGGYRGCELRGRWRVLPVFAGEAVPANERERTGGFGLRLLLFHPKILQRIQPRIRLTALSEPRFLSVSRNTDWRIPMLP